jgi:hypothetical protein
LWLALATALVVAACSAAPASADVPVVSATIYPGSHGSVGTRTALSGTLGQCPLAAATQLQMHSGPRAASSDTFPTASTWTLATVLSCGMQIPISGVTRVEVQRANGAFEASLSNADLIDTTRYQDPQAPDALPIISVNGDSGQNSYNRPYRGGKDLNATDSVTIDGAAITILVWVNSQPLRVTATQQAVPGSKAVRLSATVRTADGAPVQVSSLKWQWNFLDDGTISRQPSPTHTSSQASYNVSVQVTDQSLGAAGTRTLLVTSPTKAAPGNHKQSGGHKHTNSNSPTGKDNGGSNQTPGSGGSEQSGNSNQNSKPQSSSPTTTPTTTAAPTTSTPTTPTTSTPATTTPATTPAPPTPHRAPPKRTTSHKPAPTATGPLVTGRLIADVTPLPQKSSPLVRVTPATAAPAPTVRQATSTSPLTAIGAGLAVAALLGLGAWHELRGRRRSRAAH